MTRLTKMFVIVCMLCELAACGPSGGDAKEPADGELHSTADASVRVTSDGDSQTTTDTGTCTPTAPSAAAQQFIGAWRLVAGTTNCSCDDGQAESATADGTDIETFTVGCQPDQLIGSDATVPCPETCTVSGNTAVCEPFACSANGLEVQSTQDVYTLVDGQLNELGGGVISGSGVSCQCASSDGVLQRVQ